MWIPKELAIFLYALLAGILGGVIGLERQLANKPAGMRTHILVAISAALLVMTTDYFYVETDFKAQLSIDPLRVVQAIILGVSFLGAGTILRHENPPYIEGLTTAASLLLAAVVGILVGLKLIGLAVLVTGLIWLVNYLLTFLERWLDKRVAGRPKK